MPPLAAEPLRAAWERAVAERADDKREATSQAACRLEALG
jgi:hypothetical protein